MGARELRRASGVGIKLTQLSEDFFKADCHSALYGIIQNLDMSGVVDSQAAEAVCAHYEDRLVSSNL